MTSLGSTLILAQGHRAKDLLRRVVSRRRGRCELGLVSAMVSLLQRDQTLYNALCPHLQLKSVTSGKAGGLKKVEPLKADRSGEPLKAVRL